MGFVDLLYRLPAWGTVAVVAIVSGIAAGTIIAVVAFVCCEIGAYRQRRLKATLIQDMLDRGMSSDEIEQVLAAASMEAPEDAEEAG